MSETINEEPAVVVDIIDRIYQDGYQTGYKTKGGLRIPIYSMEGIPLAILKPTTEVGKTNLQKMVENFNEFSSPRRIWKPFTTLPVDSTPATPTAGGKRNKSKKPKRRNSRSKRRKTVSKRRR